MQQVSENANVWIPAIFERNNIEDETAYLQLGQYDEFTFYAFKTDPPQTTSWVDFPTNTTRGYFKYASFDIELSQDLISWNRQTYSFLDLVGDIGGLYDGLKLIGKAMIVPFSWFGLHVSLLMNIFRPKGS